MSEDSSEGKAKLYYEQVALIGTGLIGGSMGIALREKILVGSITGFDRDPGALEEALQKGAIDKAATSAAGAVAGADLIVLAAPVLETITLIEAILPSVKPGALITDVGSTKGWIMSAVEQLLPSGVHFIGGHPMAGSEESGIRGADRALLENAIYVLTPGVETPGEVSERLAAMLREAGAQPVILDPFTHDRVVAQVSHLPHLAAAALVQSVVGAGDSELVRTLAAGGFRDSTRIALGNPEVWRDICISNRWVLLGALKAFRENLELIEKYLSEPNRAAIEEYLSQARDYRLGVPHRGRGILPELHDLVVLVRDTPGVIGRLAGLLGDAGINIDSIEILHIRELSGGSIRLGFKQRDNQEKARELLGREGYTTHSI